LETFSENKVRLGYLNAEAPRNSLPPLRSGKTRSFSTAKKRRAEKKLLVAFMAG